MRYIKVINDVVVDHNYTFQKFCREHPTKSFPVNFFETGGAFEYGVRPLIIGEPPINPDEMAYKIVRRSSELINGEWYLLSDLVELTDDEKIQVSESSGNWNGLHLGLIDIVGFPEWVQSLESQSNQDSIRFKGLDGALGSRNIKGMQLFYDAITLPNKPPQPVRLAMNDLAIACNIAVNFLVEGDE